MKRPPLKKWVPSPAARMRASLKLAKAAVARHQAALDDPGLDGHQRNLRHERFVASRAKVRKLTEALMDMEETKMRVDLADEGFQIEPPHPGWKLRAWRALNLGGKAYRRGEEVPAAALGLNADNLLRGGHVRWASPASAPKPPPPPPPPISRSEPPPVDPIAACRSELRRIMKDRGVDFAMAVDLIDSRVYLKAQKHYADAPHEAVDGAFGSGGRGRIKTGIGTSRRSVAGFTECLREGL